MSLYVQPDEPELTEEDKLLAALVELEQRIPGGYQVGMGPHLKRSIEAVEKLFTDHNLPMREELVAELELWRTHAEDGVNFVHQCHHLMRTAMQSVHGADRSH